MVHLIIPCETKEQYLARVAACVYESCRDPVYYGGVRQPSWSELAEHIKKHHKEIAEKYAKAFGIKFNEEGSK